MKRGLEAILGKLRKAKFWFLERIWLGNSSNETINKRFRIFVVLGILFISLSKLIYLSGLSFPNLELIIPVMVVMGSFSLYTGNSKFFDKIKRYFGILAPLSVFVIDTVFWGLRPIYLFTWSGFAMTWLIGKRSNFSFLDDFSELTLKASLNTGFAILAFDIFTAFGTWMLWHPWNFSSLLGVYIAQIPFSLHHLSSLIFVPPLVGLVKSLTRVKVKIPTASKQRVKKKVR